MRKIIISRDNENTVETVDTIMSDEEFTYEWDEDGTSILVKEEDVDIITEIFDDEDISYELVEE